MLSRSSAAGAAGAPVQPFHLVLALAVETGLLDKTGPELRQCAEQDVGLVQRVLDGGFGVDLELGADPLRAVRDLEDDTRLRVDVPPSLAAERVALGGLADGRVLDVGKAASSARTAPNSYCPTFE